MPYRRTLHPPTLSEELAEFFGIMIGDGSITRYQVVIALDSLTDIEFRTYITQLIMGLFSLPVALQFRKESRCAVITINSVELVGFLVKKWFTYGQ